VLSSFPFIWLISSTAHEVLLHACLLCFRTKVVSFWSAGILFHFLHVGCLWKFLCAVVYFHNGGAKGDAALPIQGLQQ